MSILGGMDVTLPDGTTVRASPIADRVADDPSRDFGLYMDGRWDPSWPSDLIDWPNFGVPSDPERAASQIRDAFARAREGELVEVGCIGGLGRTGTVLACMTVLTGLDALSAVTWVRQNYKQAAVETEEQAQWVAWFGNWARSEAV
jgi:protein-tyrosine phosphatase